MNFLTLSEGETLLCEMLSQPSKTYPENIPGDLLLKIEKTALDAEIAGCIAHTMRANAGSSLPESWRKQHKITKKQVDEFINELDSIAGILIKNGIPIVALKNGGIARGIYPCPGCCPMGDIDVLVEKHHFRHAHEILIENGFHFEFRSPLEDAELSDAEASGGAEYWKALPDGNKFWFELQWRAVAGRWIRPDQEPSTEELMSRSIPIPGTSVRLLSPEDNLLQVCLHTAKHTYVRAPGFRLHLDVERIIHAYHDLNWQLFLNRVKRLKIKTAVYFSLYIPYILFDTPIPVFVLNELRPPIWKEQVIIQWLNRVGLFNPKERKFGKVGYILFNALLYDDFRGLLRSIFPEQKWMKKRYGFKNSFLLPWYHFRRILDLALRRVNT